MTTIQKFAISGDDGKSLWLVIPRVWNFLEPNSKVQSCMRNYSENENLFFVYYVSMDGVYRLRKLTISNLTLFNHGLENEATCIS